ncbi:unnamed protein product [Linum trigynum]|uniref:Uncharacterized protein n=1 Tax=Linum trigynum TaxID=586398 RepID=A0AAV2CPK1_9ROSI
MWGRRGHHENKKKNEERRRRSVGRRVRWRRLWFRFRATETERKNEEEDFPRRKLDWDGITYIDSSIYPFAPPFPGNYNLPTSPCFGEKAKEARLRLKVIRYHGLQLGLQMSRAEPSFTLG